MATCGSDKFSSGVRVIDKSKYGTFVSEDSGSKVVRLVRNKDTALKDGDLVTFGTSNATFRFFHVPVTIFLHCSKGRQLDPLLQASISSIGAQSSCSWNHDCTHVLVDESSSITADLLNAVVAKKPIVHIDWLKVLAEKKLCTEFPNGMQHAPTLTLEGSSIRIVDPTVRDKSLEGFTFVLGSLSKYKFGEKLQSLLEVVGAKVISLDVFFSDSQTSADGVINYVLVVPQESPNESHSRELSSLSRITDLKLVAAVLSGRLDSSMLNQPSIIVSSSHSTDETIVADSEVEIDTATSKIVPSTFNSQDAIKREDEDQKGKKSGDITDTTKCQGEKKSTAYLQTSSDNSKMPCPRDEVVASMKKLDKGDEPFPDRHENSDIIFSPDLVVRGTIPVTVQSTTKDVVNFKCFRKGEKKSGNSFTDLIPFSKDPYKESDYGSNESEYMREEKKRKQLEAVAEDLFNNEKARKRAVGGASIQSFLTRR
ncbi:nijmegen breakage syndrome 1 protein isoform X2 [Asparagus officinalis]|nr:nijmegen breakage syndrome 1 protein isoform X2 [Asparagus officinalis]